MEPHRTETGGEQRGEANKKNMQNIQLEKEQEPLRVTKNHSEEKNARGNLYSCECDA